MDYATKQRLRNYLRALERALETRQLDMARMWIGSINLLLLQGPPKPERPPRVGVDHPSYLRPPDLQLHRPPGGGSMPSLDFLPDWLGDVVADKGVRIPQLERALRVRKVVLTPAFGDFYGLQLKGEWD